MLMASRIVLADQSPKLPSIDIGGRCHRSLPDEANRQSMLMCDL